MKWGALLRCFMCLGIMIVPWVTGGSDILCAFIAGMNLQAFFESVGTKPADEVKP